MDFKIFHDIILLQFLANALDFSQENMTAVKRTAYTHPKSALNYLDKFTKYLKEMEKRPIQKIPVQIIRDMFPGDYFKDVYISGTKFLL